ncbi:MAG: AEC family transporter [Clostridia bacterium]|nr:AEC family transporter [Clostridia bacterium]
MKIIIGQPFASGTGCFESVFGCFLIFILAFVATKANILTANLGKRIHGFAVRILIPLFLFGAFQIERSSSNSVVLLNMMLIALLTTVAFAITAFFCYKNDRPATAKAEEYALTFSDYAAFGIPVMYLYMGHNGLFCCAAFILISHIAESLYGKMIMKNKLYIKKDLLSMLLSPAVIASLLGLLLYFTGLSLPGTLSNAICSAGSLASPLIIASLGIIAAGTDFSLISKSKKAIILCLIKMILFPMLVFAVCLVLGLGKGITYIAMTLSALPCSASTYFNSEKAKADINTASVVCTLTSAFSLISIPLVTFIATLILPIK